jgi:hypothetical protein
MKSLRFPNSSTLPVRHDDSTLHPHLSSIAKRFKVPFFELMKVRAAASKQCPASQLYSSVNLLYVSSLSILSSPSAICLSPRTFSYSRPLCDLEWDGQADIGSRLCARSAARAIRLRHNETVSEGTCYGGEANRAGREIQGCH